MNNLAHTIRQLQSGILERTEFFVQLDRILSSGPADAGPMLETLSEEHAKSPLPPDVYLEVKRRIAHLREARQRLGADETYVQTKPGPFAPASAATPAAADMEPGPPPERMKGVGDTLNGRFVLEECVGFGGMGTVYKALDLRKLEASDRQPYIAIKVLNVQFQGHPKSLIALQREARKAQKLAHPNIVSVYDFDRDGSMVYLTMEYLDGKPLSQVLRAPDFRGMPYADAMPIVRGMGLALAYAHERGFVHCDFKPANVILTDAGQVKVIDFGIARVFHKAEEDVDVTVFDPGSLGALTPAYASPEMIEHDEPDPRDDIYALGCITYELLTGRHPFNRMSATQARGADMHPQRPQQLGHPQWRALKCALAFERAQRTPTVSRFLEDLGEHGRVSRPVMAVAGLLAIVLATVLGRYFWPGRQDETPAPSVPAAPAIAEPAAPEPGTAAPALPRPSPPLALASVTPLLASVPCSALVASVQGHLVRVRGFLSTRYGRTRLNDMLAILPGVSAVELELQEVGDDKCPVLNVLGRFWTAHRQAGGGAAIRLNRPGASAELREGDALMVDITTPGYQSYASVDYFVLDGSVVHLLPNLRARDNLAPARYTATIGSLGDWVIGKPFGTEMVVLLATPVQLFDSLRPESEPGADYLRALERQLTLISNKHGPDKIAVDFVQIATRARRR